MAICISSKCFSLANYISLFLCSNMLSPSTLLFVLIAAGSAILLSAVPFQDTNCPTGFWCRKRSLGSSQCPTGFWCKRSANDDQDNSMCQVGFWCKRSDKIIHTPTAQGDCPTGFWCRRSLSCPTGFWCRRRRSLDSSSCPTGFWCKKDANQEEKRSLQSDECPTGFWCRRSEYIMDQDTPESDCPTGFWCRKRVINTKQVKDTRYPQRGMPASRPRPPKMPGSGPSSDNFNWDCPMGFWC